MCESVRCQIGKQKRMGRTRTEEDMVNSSRGPRCVRPWMASSQPFVVARTTHFVRDYFRCVCLCVLCVCTMCACTRIHSGHCMVPENKRVAPNTSIGCAKLRRDVVVIGKYCGGVQIFIFEVSRNLCIDWNVFIILTPEHRATNLCMCN